MQTIPAALAALPTEYDELIYANPDCVTASDTSVEVHGRNFDPNTELTVSNIDTDPDSEVTITTTAFGTFDVTLDVVPADFNYISADYPDSSFAADIYLQECIPKLIVTPQCSSAGVTSIDVHGLYWDDTADATFVELQDDNGAPVAEVNQVDVTPSGGEFDATISIGSPGLGSGNYIVYGEETTGSFYDSFEAAFQIPCPEVTRAVEVDANGACTRSGAPPDSWSIDVTVKGFLPSPSDYGIFDSFLEIVFDPTGDPQEFWADEPDDGDYNIEPYQRAPGTYTILVKQGYDQYEGFGTNRIESQATTTFKVVGPDEPCSDPLLYVTPDCLTVVGDNLVEVHGRNFEPGRDVDVWAWYDEDYVTVTPDAFGTFNTSITTFWDGTGDTRRISAVYTDDADFEPVATVFIDDCGPQVTITPKCGSSLASIDVSGTGFQTGSEPDDVNITIYDYFDDSIFAGSDSLGGSDISTGSWSTTVVFDTETFPSGLTNSTYVVAVTQLYDYVEVFLQVPCPTVTIEPICGGTGSPPDQLSLLVTAKDFMEITEINGSEELEIVFDAAGPPFSSTEPQEFDLAVANGTFLITPYSRGPGTYTVQAKQGYFAGGDEGEAKDQARCRPRVSEELAKLPREAARGSAARLG